ncbi:MAG: FAD-binding oxidoreductase [Candidatus Binataceae bacterium]
MRTPDAVRQRLILPDAPRTDPRDEASLDVWGFRDTRFQINPAGNIELAGDRYALSGHELPALLSWMSGALKSRLDPAIKLDPSYPPAIPEPIRSPDFEAAIRGFLEDDQICVEPALRLRHGHGHTQEEMYALKHGRIARVPDLVVFPKDEDQVRRLVEAAARHNVCLIPYGGGTNVTEALRCPVEETRTIVSVDMQRMNRILWIDPVNRMAEIQAGAVGRQIAEQLREHGFTMGHEPDSIEFSTLGGWVATHASGMKKNKYGNIEDLVLGVNVATAAGELSRSSILPRESVGADPRSWMFGSEGNLGIITSATVKVFPFPEVQRYGSIIFPSFEKGFDFLYELTQRGDLPASVRLVDNLQFQFSQALKPRSERWKVYKSAAERWFVTKVRGFKPDEMVACTLVFEGSKAEVEHQEKLVYGLAKKHGGMAAGGENGERGYQLTFSIAYIRDFIMNYYIIAESFETSVPWSNTLALCENVKRRVAEEHAKRKLPGQVFITGRITQLYDTGVCVYFYLAYYYKDVPNPAQVYLEIEDAARDEILKAGGSLSHHHGIGKLRRKFMPRIMSPAALEWIADVKRSVDPENIFGCGNLTTASTQNGAGHRAETTEANGFRKYHGSASG